MRFAPRIGDPWEFSIALPFLNRRRPFIAVHFALEGCRIRGGVVRPTYALGIIWGRRFMPRPSGGAKWFRFTGFKESA